MSDPIVRAAVKRQCDAGAYRRMCDAKADLEDLSDAIEAGRAALDTGDGPWGRERLAALQESLDEASHVIQSIFDCLCEGMDPEDTK